MTNVFVTGATGNVGSEVIRALSLLTHNLKIFAGVRVLNEETNQLFENDVQLVRFDFNDITTYANSLKNCDILFLLRPPQISDVEKYFKPLIHISKENGVKHIVFLSVQGVEKSKIIPHHKIEKLILESNVPYTFLRPAYFMQNFTRTLQKDLVSKKRIYLPAGNAKFTLINIEDIGAVTAKILTNISEHINVAYELTNNEKLTFTEMVSILSKGLSINIKYQSPNLFRFFLTKRKENVPTMFIFVMIMLHYLPRFQKEPLITDWVEKITNKQPTSFEKFVSKNKKLLLE